jgi:hypothetical protein
MIFYNKKNGQVLVKECLTVFYIAKTFSSMIPQKDEKYKWFKVKPYLHLTNKLATQGTDSKDFKKKREQIIQWIENPDWVKKHAFFPLLRYDIIERKYKKRTIEAADGSSILLQKKERKGKIRPFRSHKKANPQGKRELKSTRKERPIEFPTHIDSLIYGY